MIKNGILIKDSKVIKKREKKNIQKVQIEDNEPLKAEGFRSITMINLDNHKIHRDIEPRDIMPKLSSIATKPSTEKLLPFKSPFLA